MPELLVCVARDLDDDRAIYLPLRELHNPHVATHSGGRREPLDRLAVGGYIDRELIPPDAPFGHDGNHGQGRLKVLVQEDRTSAAVRAELRERVPSAKLRGRLAYRELVARWLAAESSPAADTL